jgi:hydrogenase-4 component F
MLAIALFVVPLLLALAAAVVRDEIRPRLVPLGGFTHLALVTCALIFGDAETYTDWLQLDALGRLVLPEISILFFACSLYVPTYLRQRRNRPNRLFCIALLASLSMMTLMVESQHLGLMWVALEASTLASAPLLYFNRNSLSLEATWKYIVIGAVGIALALLGSFFLAYSALSGGARETSLLFGDLVAQGSLLSKPWLHAAFVMLFIGYGTKMGLAPMHSWKPDAYGEAPGVVGALLAGGVTSCAFLALLRFFHINDAGGDGEFARELFITIGLVSMAVGGVFMARQRDFKRMLAYSSVEHMGILVLGVGIGGLALYGALLHLITNALTKGVMFLAAANIHRAYGSKSTEVVRGAIRRVPISGWLFLIGFFAVTASPPFAMFLSEFTMLRGIIAEEQYAVAALFLILIFVVFVGMGSTVVSMVQGKPPDDLPANQFPDRFGTVFPIILLLALVLVLGVYIPPPLDDIISEAAALLEPR